MKLRGKQGLLEHVIPLGILVFSFSFFMDCLARRRRAKAELIIESLRSGGEGAQQGPLE